MKLLNIVLFVLSLSLLVAFGMYENKIIINAEKKYWDKYDKIDWNDFKRTPDYVSNFDAGIASTIRYEPIHDVFDSLKIQAFMYPGYSWVKEETKKYEECLRHEQYHFNISELIARKFRKVLLEMPQYTWNKYNIDDLNDKYLRILNNLQDQYDDETGHGVKIEIQKDWEYDIDSLLCSYAFYSSPIITHNKEFEIRHDYYRRVEIDPKNQLVGRYPLDSADAVGLQNYYRFYYNHDSLSKIEYWCKNKITVDNDFKVAVIKIQRQKNIEKWLYYDPYGKPMKGSDSVSCIVLERGKRKLIKTYEDENGTICAAPSGFFKSEWMLDWKKRRILGKVYDKNNKQIADNDGYYNIKISYSAEDNILEYANYDSTNSLLDNKKGIAFVRYFYDQKDNICLIKTFNSESMFSPDSTGYAVLNYQYDLNGNIIRQCYYKANGELYINENNIAISYFEYDEKGNIIMNRNYGANKNLIIDEEKNGKVETKFDKQGRIVEITNYDAYDNLYNNKTGFCKKKYYYNDSSLMRKEEFYTYKHDTLSLLKKYLYLYDSKRNLVCEQYYTELNLPCPDSNAVFLKRYKYDERNNLIQVENYNKMIKLQPSIYNVAIIKYKYDQYNNRIENSYYDITGNITTYTGNYAIERFKYNKQRQVIEHSYFNVLDKPTLNPDLCDMVKYEYDSFGNNILRSNYVNNKLSDDKYGIAFIKYYFDDRKNDTLIEYYDQDSKLVNDYTNGISILKYEFTPGNKVRRASYYDKDTFLVNCPDGYAIEKILYDKNEKAFSMEYYSKYNTPVITRMGYASVDYMYDRNQNTMARITWGVDRKLIEDEHGYAIYNWEYNRNGDVTDTYKYDDSEENLWKINTKIKHNNRNTFKLPDLKKFGSEDIGNRKKLESFYENGQKKDEAYYLNGKPDGKFTSWYENGAKESEIEYKNGMREGKTTEYYKNGNKKSEITYHNNFVVSNSEITWYENGKVNSMCKDGELIEYDKDGKVVFKEEKK